MCSCHSILECCVTFSGVKLSIKSFVLSLPCECALLRGIPVDSPGGGGCYGIFMGQKCFF